MSEPEIAPRSLHRRTLVSAAAWTIPAVAVALAAPMAVASTPTPQRAVADLLVFTNTTIPLYYGPNQGFMSNWSVRLNAEAGPNGSWNVYGAKVVFTATYINLKTREEITYVVPDSRETLTSWSSQVGGYLQREKLPVGDNYQLTVKAVATIVGGKNGQTDLVAPFPIVPEKTVQSNVWTIPQW